MLAVLVLFLLFLHVDALVAPPQHGRSTKSGLWDHRRKPEPGDQPLKNIKDTKGTESSVSQQDNMDRVMAKFDDWLDSISNTSWPLLEGNVSGLFQYADTRVETFSVEGLLFLCTNIPFFMAAQIVRSNGNMQDVTLMSLAPALDVSGVLSFLYHYSQLYYGPNRNEVKRFLFADYISAFFTCSIVILEVFPFMLKFTEPGAFRVEPFFCGLLSIGTLLLSWRYDQGRCYLLWHGLWHVLSAYTCVLLTRT